MADRAIATLAARRAAWPCRPTRWRSVERMPSGSCAGSCPCSTRAGVSGGFGTTLPAEIHVPSQAGRLIQVKLGCRRSPTVDRKSWSSALQKERNGWRYHSTGIPQRHGRGDCGCRDARYGPVGRGTCFRSVDKRQPCGLGPREIVLDVNGMGRAVTVEPQATLAEVLRDTLELTGTKIGCDRGACARLHGVARWCARLSCMMLAIDVGEPRSSRSKASRAARAAPGAVGVHRARCGAMRLLHAGPGDELRGARRERNPDPSVDDVKAAISGHLCRCGPIPMCSTQRSTRPSA